MPISGRFSYVCLRCTLPIDYLGVWFYESLVFSASIVAGLNTKVDRAFVPGAPFRSGPPSLFAWVGFETRCIFEMGCETRGGSSFSHRWGHFSVASGTGGTTIPTKPVLDRDRAMQNRCGFHNRSQGTTAAVPEPHELATSTTAVFETIAKRVGAQVK